MENRIEHFQSGDKSKHRPTIKGKPPSDKKKNVSIALGRFHVKMNR